MWICGDYLSIHRVRKHACAHAVARAQTHASSIPGIPGRKTVQEAAGAGRVIPEWAAQCAEDGGCFPALKAPEPAPLTNRAASFTWGDSLESLQKKTAELTSYSRNTQQHQRQQIYLRASLRSASRLQVVASTSPRTMSVSDGVWSDPATAALTTYHSRRSSPVSTAAPKLRIACWMQDPFSLSPKFSFGATAGKERGLITSLSAEMKSAEEGKWHCLKFIWLSWCSRAHAPFCLVPWF